MVWFTTVGKNYMSFLSNVIDAFREPNPKEVLRDLRNLFGALGEDKLKNDRASEDMLVAFGMTLTTQTGIDLLDAVPSIKSCIGPVTQHLRAYFECYWQLEMLSKCKSPEEFSRVSNIYSIVDLRTDVISRKFWDLHPKMENVFGCVFDSRYRTVFSDGVREYIRGERAVPLPESDDLGFHGVNLVALTFKLQAIIQSSNAEHEAILRVLVENQELAGSIVFLSKFDFENCPAFGLPPSWLDQPE